MLRINHECIPRSVQQNGHTIGGGIELALCCDIRIASPAAKFSTPEVTLGMIPGWMGIERVLNQVGPTVGRQMLMLGKRLTAQQAQAAGLINEVVEKAQVESWMANRHVRSLPWRNAARWPWRILNSSFWPSRTNMRIIRTSCWPD